MENINELVNQLVDDIEEIPEDAAVQYEVWAIGFDEAGNISDVEDMLATFDNPDRAVEYAKTITLADVVHLTAGTEYDPDKQVQSIYIEVETVVPDDGGTMNIGTIYRNVIEISGDDPDFVSLGEDDYTIMENGNIQVSCEILKDYNKNDYFFAVFKEDNCSMPMNYRIISKTTSGHYICEFV